MAIKQGNFEWGELLLQTRIYTAPSIPHSIPPKLSAYSMESKVHNRGDYFDNRCLLNTFSF